MRRVCLVLAAALLLLSACSLSQDNTRRRVTHMMDAWQSAGTSSDGNMQEAISMWYDGSRAIADDVELSRQSEKFDAWRRQKQLYREIHKWEITSIEESSDVHGLVVALSIDDKPYTMRVEAGEPIEWM